MLPAEKFAWNWARVSFTKPSEPLPSFPVPSNPHGFRSVTHCTPDTTDVATTVYAWLPITGAPPVMVVLVIAAAGFPAAIAVVSVLKIDAEPVLKVLVATPRSANAEPVQPQFKESNVLAAVRK